MEYPRELQERTSMFDSVLSLSKKWSSAVDLLITDITSNYSPDLNVGEAVLSAWSIPVRSKHAQKQLLRARCFPNTKGARVTQLYVWKQEPDEIVREIACKRLFSKQKSKPSPNSASAHRNASEKKRLGINLDISVCWVI